MSRTSAIAHLDRLDDVDIEPLKKFLRDHDGASVEVELVAADGSRASVPARVADVVRRVIGAAADGRAMDVVDDVDEVTPNEAAALLGVSRNTVLKLVDEGDLTARRVPGSRHRRLPRADVMAFRARRRALENALAAAAEVALEEDVWDAELRDGAQTAR